MQISQVSSSNGALMRVLLHTKEGVVSRNLVPALGQDLGRGKILQGTQNVERGMPPRLLLLLLQCVLIQAVLLLPLSLLCQGLLSLSRLPLFLLLPRLLLLLRRLLLLLLLGLWVVGLLLLLLLFLLLLLLLLLLRL